jgi:hypothetical protein
MIRHLFLELNIDMNAHLLVNSFVSCSSNEINFTKPAFQSPMGLLV